MWQRPHYFRQDTSFPSATAKGKHTSSCAADKMALTSSAFWWNEWEVKYVPCSQPASSPESNRETQKLSQLVIKRGPRLRGFFCYCCLAKYELENFLGIKLSRMHVTPNKGIYRKVGENFSSEFQGKIGILQNDQFPKAESHLVEVIESQDCA